MAGLETLTETHSHEPTVPVQRGYVRVVTICTALCKVEYSTDIQESDSGFAELPDTMD